MLLHTLLITYRIFKRHSTSFLINLIGLSTGLASILLIYLWVYDELSFDKFHQKDNRLFQLMRNTSGASNAIETHESNSDLLAPALALQIPEIEYVLPLTGSWNGVLSVEKKNLKAKGKFAGKDFFNLFSYRLLAGDKKEVLADKYSIVLSDELAIKLLGTLDNIVGKTVIWNEEPYVGAYIISGVFKQSTQNTSEPFDFLLTNDLFIEKRPKDRSWFSNGVEVYLALKPGVELDRFKNKLAGFIHLQEKTCSDVLFVRPYADKYLYDHYENGVQAGGRIDYVLLFSTIAFFILLMACINFMNLSTAKASKRSKEIGIKKTIGAGRATLILQYLAESTMLAFLSLAVALLMVFLLLPAFNDITGKHLSLTWDVHLFGAAFLITLLTGVLAGGYPALYLSGFKPIVVLKGKVPTSVAELWVRQGLVVVQFTLSIIFIVTVLVLYRQINYVQSKNLGYNKDNIISFETKGNLTKSLEPFLQEAKRIPGVANATRLSGSVTNFTNRDWGHSWEGQPIGGSEIEFTHGRVGYDFIETMGIKLKEGRSFSREFGKEETKIILNEKAIEVMQLSDPIGRMVNIRGNREVIGVVKNFHFQSLHEPVKPMYFIYELNFATTALIKIQAGQEQETINKLEKLVQSYQPGISFDFTFVDDQYQALYVAEQKVSDLSLYFASIAILISCLGLYGLVFFTIERRAKEISIRKILGSTNMAIVYLLSGEFSKLVILSIGIALPVSYVIARHWLDAFTYRISLDAWYFILSGLLALLIAGITVGIQAIKAARMHPIQSLREA